MKKEIVLPEPEAILHNQANQHISVAYQNLLAAKVKLKGAEAMLTEKILQLEGEIECIKSLSQPTVDTDGADSQPTQSKET